MGSTKIKPQGQSQGNVTSGSMCFLKNKNKKKT